MKSGDVMSTITEKIANVVVKFDYKDLAEDAIHEAKRLLLDTLGCMIGGYDNETSQIVLKVLRRLGGREESTIIGSGAKTSCINATLANAVMARVLDFNDVARGGVHPSEMTFPPALALGESESLNGRDIITAVVLGYEFLVRLGEGCGDLSRKGWSANATIGQLVSPIVAGKLLALDEDKLANAIAVSGCHNVSLAEIWFGKVTMMKSLVNALSSQSGVIAALLAREGFTGSKTVFEGKRGFNRMIVDGKMDLDVLVEDVKEPFRIGKRWKRLMKAYASCAGTHSAMEAALKLVKKHNLMTKDIQEVNVGTVSNNISMLAKPGKDKPISMFDAQFSLPYSVAVVIAEGDGYPDKFSEEKIRDAKILRIAKRVKVKRAPELEEQAKLVGWPPAVVEIITKRGEKYEQRVDFPKGDCLNPFTDEEVKAKFRYLSFKAIDQERIDQIIKTVYSLEKVEDISVLMELLGGKRRP